MLKYIFTVLLLPLTVHAEEICYKRTYQLQVQSSPTELYEQATDVLEILEKDKTKIKFHLKIYGWGYSSCEMYGLAYRSGNSSSSYIFLDEKKYWYENELSDLYGQEGNSCGINMELNNRSVKVTQTGMCLGFCGARAAFISELSEASDCKSALKN